MLPAAINLGTTFLAAGNRSARLRIRSLAFDEVIELSLVELTNLEPQSHWGDYFAGVARELSDENSPRSGLDILLDSDLPVGSGLSSSASLTIGFACLLNDIWNLQHDIGNLIYVAQRAENNFAGLACGVLDPFAVAMGRVDHVISLRCSDMQWDYVPFPSDRFSIVIANTGVSRQLAQSSYNQRREESGEALASAVLRSGCASACELSEADLEFLRTPDGGSTLWRRARHVVTENDRVQVATRSLQAGDMIAFGAALVESHQSLRDDYAASCVELDTMVELALQHRACIGAKMSGAGFGGAVVAVVNADSADDFVDELDTKYQATSRHTPSFHSCRIGAGAHKLQLDSQTIKGGAHS